MYQRPPYGVMQNFQHFTGLPEENPPAQKEMVLEEAFELALQGEIRLILR